MSLSVRWNRCPKLVQLLLILVTVAVIGWIRYQGISLEGDPIAYAKLAAWDSMGLPPWSEWTFTSRVGLTNPTSFVLSTVGIHRWAFIVWPFVCFLILVLTIWWKLRGDLQFYTLVLVLLCPWPAAYGLQLLPDLPMLAFVALGLALLPHLSPIPSRKSWFAGTGFTLVFLISGLCKLTVLYLLPFLGVLMILDLIKDRNRVFWISVMLSGCLILFLYGIWGMSDGDFLSRLAQIERDHNSSPFSYSWKDSAGMFRRLFIEPVVSFFGNPGVAILLFPAAAALFTGHLYLKPALITLLYLLGIHWLGSTSLAHYSPLPADPRMWILISVPLLLLAGIGMEETSKRSTISKTEMGLWLGMMVLFALMAWAVPLPGLVITLVSGLIFIPFPAVRKWSYLTFIGLLILWAGYNVFNKDNQYYQQQEVHMLQTQLSDSAVLYADPVLVFSSFLYEAEGIQSITEWPDSLPQESNDLFFLWNGFRYEQANLYEDRIVLPPYFDDIRSSWELVEQIDAFNIQLYKHPNSGK